MVGRNRYLITRNAAVQHDLTRKSPGVGGFAGNRDAVGNGRVVGICHYRTRDKEIRRRRNVRKREVREIKRQFRTLVHADRHVLEIDRVVCNGKIHARTHNHHVRLDPAGVVAAQERNIAGAVEDHRVVVGVRRKIHGQGGCAICRDGDIMVVNRLIGRDCRALLGPCTVFDPARADGNRTHVCIFRRRERTPCGKCLRNALVHNLVVKSYVVGITACGRAGEVQGAGLVACDITDLEGRDISAQLKLGLVYELAVTIERNVALCSRRIVRHREDVNMHVVLTRGRFDLQPRQQRLHAVRPAEQVHGIGARRSKAQNAVRRIAESYRRLPGVGRHRAPDGRGPIAAERHRRGCRRGYAGGRNRGFRLAARGGVHGNGLIGGGSRRQRDSVHGIVNELARVLRAILRDLEIPLVPAGVAGEAGATLVSAGRAVMRGIDFRAAPAEQSNLGVGGDIGHREESVSLSAIRRILGNRLCGVVEEVGAFADGWRCIAVQITHLAHIEVDGVARRGQTDIREVK